MNDFTHHSPQLLGTSIRLYLIRQIILFLSHEYIRLSFKKGVTFMGVQWRNYKIVISKTVKLSKM